MLHTVLDQLKRAAKIEQLEVEIIKLRKQLERFPKDHDGNPVIPHFDKIYHPSDPPHQPRHAAFTGELWEALPLFEGVYQRAPVSDCFLSYKRTRDATHGT